MSLPHVHAEDAPVDANCGPRCVDFLVEYVDLPDEQLRSMITEFDALDEQPGVTFQQLARALERRGPAISADSIPTDFMIESDAPVVLHLNPLGSNSLGHFAVLLPTSTPTHSDVWVGVEGVQSGSPLQLRPQMSGEAIAVSSKPARTAVRALSPLRIAIAENYHWFPVALPGLAIILPALLLMKLRTVPHLSQQGGCLAPFNDNCPTYGDSVFGCPCRDPLDTLSCSFGNLGTTNWPNLVPRLGTPVLAQSYQGYATSTVVSVLCSTVVTCMPGCFYLSTENTHICDQPEIAEIHETGSEGTGNTVACDNRVAQSSRDYLRQQKVATINGVGIHLFSGK